MRVRVCVRPCVRGRGVTSTACLLTSYESHCKAPSILCPVNVDNVSFQGTVKFMPPIIIIKQRYGGYGGILMLMFAL